MSGKVCKFNPVRGKPLVKRARRNDRCTAVTMFSRNAFYLQCKRPYAYDLRYRS